MVQENFKKTVLIFISLWFFLLPLFVLPQISPFLDFAKRLLALVFLAVFIFLSGIKVFLEGEIKIKYSRLSLLLLLFAFCALLSALFSPNKIDSLFTVSPLIIGSLLFFIFENLLSEEETQNLLPIVIVSGVFISLFTLLQEINAKVGVVSPLPQANKSLEQIVLDRNFSFLGSLLTQFLFLATLLPVSTWLSRHSKNEVQKNLAIFSLILLLVGFTLTFKNFIQSKPGFLDYSNSWRIAVNTLSGGVKEALLGVGPGNYAKSLNLYKNINYNNNQYWNTEFPTGHSEILNILVTSGLLGFLALLFIISALFRRLLHRKDLLSLASLVFLVGVVVFPIPIFFWLFFFSFLPFLISGHENLGTLLITKEPSENNRETPSVIVAVYLIFVVSAGLLLFYLAGRLALAEYYFNRSFRFTDASNVFSLQTKALSLYPYSENYHITMSRTNLAIGNALAAKKKLSDEDKKIALNHIQLAIEEARRAVLLNPERKANLENLADIYQSLAPGFKGAEDFALQNYTNALGLAPLNPDLYIKRGGVFLSKNDLQNALRDFSASANLKPDLANAHYNLSFVYEKTGDFNKALEELSIITRLIPRKDPNYKKIEEDIKRIKNLQIASASAQPILNLPPTLPPSPTPTPILTATPKPSVSPTPTLSL